MSDRNARAGLPFLIRVTDRVGRDRLEILTALIAGPSFDPIFRPDVIEIPRQHPIYRWDCVVGGCERSRSGAWDLCPEHLRQWARERDGGLGKAAFSHRRNGLEAAMCGPRSKHVGCVPGGRLRIPSCGCASGT